MKLSFDWLGDFVDLSGLSAQDVADKLTMGAFEVEEVSSSGPDIEGPLVVGQILEIHPHPDADKIRLTKIKLAEDAPAQEIVCGAWNIEVGQRIPVALPGAKVINRHDGSALHIKQSKIRGVTSNGMLCSAPELGISGNGEGIMILEASTKIGADAREILGIKKDYVLHVEPRSNRGDALSVLGLAREVAALFGRPLKTQAWLSEFAAMSEDGSLPFVDCEIENQDDCPYFTLRALSGFAIGPSHPDIAARLEAVGLKTINNVVDVTNYVLYELGQPLHAYDLAALQGNKLSVRRARDGESLQTIDQKERQLNPDVLAISDTKEVVGVAGVMGGKGSEVSDNTKTIVLEAACFASARVRRSSRVLGLSSDSSLRFERGVDSLQVLQSSNRASYLLQKYCNAKMGKLSSAGNDAVPDRPVQLRMSELKRICQINLSSDECAKMLEPLGFQKQESNEQAVTVKVPSFRQKDVYREIDLIEEVCRLYGYDRLPVSMPASTIAAKTPDPLPRKVRQILCSAGFNEAWISSLTSIDELDARQNGTISDTAVEVQNPLSAEHQVLRQSLIPGLIKAASYNQDRGNADPCLFELGKVYRKDSRRINQKQPANRQTGTHEEYMISAIACAEPKLSLWMQEKTDDNNGRSYFLIKGTLENLAAVLRLPAEALRFEESKDIPGYYHPGRSAACMLNLPRKKSPILLGYIGEIHPGVADTYRLSGRAGLMEISLQALADAHSDSTFKEIYQTPQVQRDITADLEYLVSHQDVESCIREVAGNTLVRVELVSQFKMSEAQKSLSYRLTFQDPEKTLTSDNVDAGMQKVREALTQKLKASFRL